MKKLGRLVEITRILDRNRDDGAFVQIPDAEIIYVLDTNVVQMFLEPYRNPQHAELFHSRVWGREYDRYTALNRQACLLMGEFLMSGLLPGQKDRRWFMSRSHYRELDNQIDWLKAETDDNIRLLKDDIAFQRNSLGLQQSVQAALEIDPADRDTILDLAERSGDETLDLDELRRLPPELLTDRGVAIRAREICRLLAGDRIFEPVDQLRRFYSKAVLGRMSHVETLFRPRADDKAVIDDEKTRWSHVLMDVITARPQNERTRDAVQNDAETLAHLGWAATHRLAPNQKLVLVTGDRALYDAYRRRHIEDRDSSPFLLRPLSQYAPLMNPSSAESTVQDREEAFGLIRSAIETATMALNLSLFGRDAKDYERKSRARDHFILEAERPAEGRAWLLRDLFPNFFEPKLLADQDDALSALATPLQRVEKLMLGAYPNLVASRIASETQRADFLKSVTSEGGRGMAEALQTRLREAAERGFLYSLPLMPQQVRKLLSMQVVAGDWLGRRALVSLRLGFPNTDGEMEVLGRSDILARLNDAGEELPKLLQELADEPASIFALASLLSFGVEDWEEAARYAELAVSAIQIGDDPTTDHAKRDQAETLYLRATALRFQLASLTPDPAGASYDIWAQWLAMSEEALSKCIAAHQERGELSREIRGLSERAAARLAYAEWGTFGTLNDVAGAEERSGAGLEAYEGAVEDLVRCYALLPEAVSRAQAPHNPGRTLSLETLEAAETQFKLNTAAAVLVGQELLLSMPDRGGVERSLARLPLPDAWPDVPPTQIMMNAYVLAATGRWADLVGIDGSALALPLDVCVLGALQRRASRELRVAG